ncbi:tetraacyldisaccharide 4'-kinase [Endothiovibrio diazotrophicus]
MIAGFLERCWYRGHPFAWVLIPPSWLFAAIAAARRLAYRVRLFKAHRIGVPVIVVGNLTVGGSGKTPLTEALVRLLREEGYRPGVVSRGYGGKAERLPREVGPDSDPYRVGDETVLLARRCGCPVAAGADRVAAARLLRERFAVDVVVSDDGLQHYALARDIEIVVVDGARRFGNGRLLPAGPLREPPGRLRQADLVVANGASRDGEFAMELVVAEVVNLLDETLRRPLETFRGEAVHAVAGIGHPPRFFAELARYGVVAECHPFPDHHAFAARELEFGDSRAVLMTEKDGVKYRRHAANRHWYVPVTARFDEAFRLRLLTLLNRSPRG